MTGMAGMTLGMRVLLAMALLAALPAQAQVVEYIHTDALGTPIAVTDASGTVIERFEYEPYGLQVAGPVEDGPGYTGHVEDTLTGMTYMQQRYYDPVVERFLSVDPVTAYSGAGANFNRYWYGNENPYRLTDPDGRNPVTGAAVGCAITGPACPAGAVIGAVAGAIIGIGLVLIYNEIAESSSDPSEGNTNPYKGPVDEPVIVVDGDGNAIPIETGEQIQSSPDGNYQQVEDSTGEPTGTRLDKGGHKNQNDPQARGPHAHRPGVKDDKGNPHLPINERKVELPPRPT